MDLHALRGWHKRTIILATNTDLALGDRGEPVLEALIRAGGGRLSGVRYSVGYDADSLPYDRRQHLGEQHPLLLVKDLGIADRG